MDQALTTENLRVMEAMQRLDRAQEKIRAAIPQDLTANETILVLSMIISDLSLRLITDQSLEVDQLLEG